MSKKDRLVIFAKLIAEASYRNCEKGMSLEQSLIEIEKLVLGNDYPIKL